MKELKQKRNANHGVFCVNHFSIHFICYAIILKSQLFSPLKVQTALLGLASKHMKWGKKTLKCTHLKKYNSIWIQNENCHFLIIDETGKTKFVLWNSLDWYKWYKNFPCVHDEKIWLKAPAIGRILTLYCKIMGKQ